MTEGSSGESEGLLARLTAGSRVAGYRLEEQIGAGGMAVVFRARDERLGRVVALKVLAPGLAADPDYRRRFIGESRAAAAVDDPHIIPVYEAGEASGVLFIAMRFVPGGDLRSGAGPAAPGRAAEIVLAVASALDAAHEAGLVHRDVKPGNVLVDVRPGRPDHVYLSDFGLSKGVLSSVGTATGQFVGTPDFSAPEQVAGAAVDGRTDQYALGCLAFWLLAGKAPFNRQPPVAVLWAHLSEPPPRLSEQRAGLPPAVDEVLARALAKTPGDRYGSCGEFAAALTQALDAVPERPAGLGQAAAGGAEGAPPGIPTLKVSPADGVLSVDATILPTVAEASSAAGPPAGASADGAKEFSPATAAASAKPEELPVVVDPAPASADGPAGPPGGSARLSRRARRAAAIGAALIIALGGSLAMLALLRGPALAVSARRVLSLSSPGGAGDDAQFSPDGQLLAVTGAVGTEVWNLRTHRLDHQIYGGAARPGSMAEFSPSGRILAVAGLTNQVYLWDVVTGQLITLIDRPSQLVLSIAFSPNGRTLAVLGDDGRAELWDVAARRVTTTLTDPGGEGLSDVAFSPRGRILAVESAENRVYLWNLAAHRYIATLQARGQNTGSMVFSPDGQILAVRGGLGPHAAAVEGNDAYLWDVRTRRRLRTLTDPRSAGAGPFSFSPDSQILASADGNGHTYLWDVATGALLATLADPGHSIVESAEFSPVGRAVATVDYQGRVILWRITELPAGR